MLPGNYDITLQQGASFHLPITYYDENKQAIDLTDFTGRMQIRSAMDNSLGHELSTENGGIILGSGLDNIRLVMSPNVTQELPEQAVYDLFVYTGDQADAVIAGMLTLKSSVTE